MPALVEGRLKGVSNADIRERTVLETILDWSQSRPMWQRDALRRIVAKGRLDQNDHADLLKICKRARGSIDTGPEPTPLAQAHIPSTPGNGDCVTLTSLSAVRGVNNLAPDQTLTFQERGLSIIYGDNGSGKSGYARVLKQACTARFRGSVLGNVYSKGPRVTPAATITYRVGGICAPAVAWQESEHVHEALSAISVFDCECATVHIKGKNEVAFRPFGLDVPDELAGACQVLRDALTREREELGRGRHPVFATPTWSALTPVGRALSALTHETSIAKLEALATLTDDERARLARLTEDLAKDPARVAREQTVKADSVRQLSNLIRSAGAATSDTALAAVAATAAEAKAKRDAASIAAARAFGAEPLASVGGDVWRMLWEAARRYSTEAAYPGQAFPPAREDARCVLCQQPVEAEARNRMARFEEFIRQDTELQAREAEKVAATARGQLEQANVGARQVKGNMQELSLRNQALARRTRRYLATCRLRRYIVLNAVKAGVWAPVLPPAGETPLDDLLRLETETRNYAAEIGRSAIGEERRRLQAERMVLADRALLGTIMDVVAAEIARLKAIVFVDECLSDTTTNTITTLGNAIADQAITPRLRDRFQEEIVKLASNKVRVEIVRAGGRYGAPEYQVRLFAKPDAKVHDVLSEGEKTCVALAAFLTELATALHSSALVFDDPITSLDHRWRNRVARRLVEEARTRQIIIFTHDLIFVNDLQDRAKKDGQAVQLTTLSRGPAGAGLVESGLPWQGKRVEDRIDKLEKAARVAKLLHDQDREGEYRTNVVDIYSKLRASWERALEEVAFSRVVLRHRDYIDTSGLKKVSALTQADGDAFAAGFGKCSDVTSAHDPSSGRNAEVPLPDELLADIQALKTWVESLRDRQKQIA